MADAVYLQLAAANKYRFFANITVDDSSVIEGGTNPLVVSVLVLDDTSEPAMARTSVRFEIGYALAGQHWSSDAGAPVYDTGQTNGTAEATGNWR